MSSPKLNRRSAIRAQLAAAAATAGAALAGPVQAQSRVELSVALLDNSLRGQSLANRLAQRLAVTSGNRISLSLANSSDPLSIFNQVGAGSINGYLGVSEDLMEVDPAMGVFTAMPFGLSALEFEAWIHHGGGQQLWDGVMAPHGIKPILAGDEGPRFAGWFNAPLSDANAMRGLRMNSVGLGDIAVSALGGTPVRLNGARIATGADASISYGLSNDAALGLSEAFSTLVTPSMFQPQRAISLGLNAAFWSSLSAEDQELIASCCEAEANVMMTERLQQDMTEFLALSDAGYPISPLEEGVFVAMGQTATEAIGDTMAGGSSTPYVFDAYQAFLSEVSGWTWVGEALFSVARANALRSAS